MMASKTFTKVADQPACPLDKAEKLAEDLRWLKKVGNDQDDLIHVAGMLNHQQLTPVPFILSMTVKGGG